MTLLGEQLAKTLRRIAEDEQRKIDEKERELRRKMEKDRRRRQNLIDELKQKITHGILDGKAPRIEVDDWEHHAWLMTLQRNSAFRKGIPDVDLWEAFEMWASNNGLKAKIDYAHDGVGIKSWSVVSVSPDLNEVKSSWDTTTYVGED